MRVRKRTPKRTPKQPLCQSLALPAVTRPLSANSAESVSSIVAVTPTAMKSRYRLVCRGSRGGKFYCYDTRLRQRTRLNTTDRRAAVQIVNAKNQAEQQPALNLQLAKTRQSVSGGNGQRHHQAHVGGCLGRADRAEAPREPRALGARGERPSLRAAAALDHHRDSGRAHAQSASVRHGLHEHLSPASAQFLRRYELAAVAAGAQAPVARCPLQGKARHHGGRASPNCRARAESRAKGVLSTFLALGRFAIGLGPFAGRGRRLECGHHLLRADEDALARGAPPQIRFGKAVAAILAERPKTGSLFPYLQNVEPGHRATDQPHARSLDFHITPIAVGRFPFQPDRGFVQNSRELLLLTGMFAPFVAGMVIIVDADRPAFVEATTIAFGGRKQDERIGHG